jgi:hypothetical protein
VKKIITFRVYTSARYIPQHSDTHPPPIYSYRQLKHTKACPQEKEIPYYAEFRFTATFEIII